MNSKKILIFYLALLASCGVWAQNTWTVQNLSGSTFTVSRTNTSVAETVIYRTVNLSAYAGIHYTAKSDTLIFDVNVPSRSVTVSELSPSSDNAYKYQTGTQRSYRFEVTDQGGFYLAHCTRNITTGTQFNADKVNQSVTNLVYFSGSGSDYVSGLYSSKYLDVTYTPPTSQVETSGTLQGYVLIDDSYDYAQKAATVSTSDLISSTGASASYLNTQNYKIYATVCFTEKERDDGYQYIQIVAGNGSASYDTGYDPNGQVNDPVNSVYKTCFELSDGSNAEGKQFFPHRYSYANKSAETSAAIGITEFSQANGHLWQHKFKSGYQATNSGSLIFAPTVTNITTRFDAGGDNDDTWGYKDLFVRMTLVDASAPTKQDVTVAPGKHCKGNYVYVSVAFNEIVTVSGTPTLSTNNNWGSLSYIGGSGSNVLTFRGTIPDNATGSLNVTGLIVNSTNTVKDLAGNDFTWSGSHTLCSLDANFAFPITYDLAGGSVATANPATYTWATGSFTLTNPTREGYTFAGWTGTGLNEPAMTVTVANHSHGDRYYTATWTPITYNLSYNLGGGSLATPNPDTYTIETPDFTLTTPTREGYTFAGWTGTGLDAATQTVTVAQGSTGHRSYTATWEIITYNITYDYGIYGVSADNPATYTIETPTFTLTNPAPTGCIFLGWTGTGLDAATQTVTIAQGSTGDRSYTANWNNLWGVDADHDGTTAERAYVITTTEGLDLLATLVNGGNDFSGTFFKLGANIAYTYASQWYDTESTENNYTSIGTLVGNIIKFFSGTFDGCGHTVSGIRINASNSYKGLFGYIEGTVKNVILSDSRITGRQEVGGIVGENSGGTVENCHATATVAIYSRTSGPNPYEHGGIVGYNNGITATATVVGCTSAATVSGTGNNYGGVVGRNYYATVSRCLALGATVTANDYSGPVVGGSNNNNVTDCHYRHCTVGGNAQNDLYAIIAGTGVTLAPSGAATATYPCGGLQLYGSAILCGDTLYAPAGATVSLDLINSVSSGQLGYTYDGFAASAGTLGGSANPYTLTLPSQDVTISAANLVDHWGIADGADGTYEHPYVITTPEGLLLLSAETNGGNSFDYAYFKLGADIDMSGVANFRPINNFSGTFDGCRHTIGHLTAYWPDDYPIGLFGDLNGTVQNVTLSDASVTGSYKVGAIVGDNYGTIENCVVLNTTVTGINYVGAIAGDNHGPIENCVVLNTTVTGSDIVGAIAGDCNGTIENCVVLNTTVTGTSECASVGAIVGYVYYPEYLTSNYYHNCTVVRNGVTATSDIGTNDGDVNDIANGIHRAVEGDLFTLDVAAGQWQAIATPLTNNGSYQYLALTDLATGSYDLFGYDEYNATWENMNGNFPDYLDRGDGYIYRSATGGTRTFVGLPNSGSSIWTYLYYRCSNEALKGFNLVGNPYNQPIAFSDISVPAGDGAIAPGYYTLDGDGTWQAHTAGTIAPGQGFLLQVTEPRSSQNYALIQIDRPAGKSSSQPSTSSSAGIAFTVSDGSHSDIAYALFAEGVGLRKMAHLDAEAPSLSIPQGAQRYAIATLSDSTQAFPLALQATAGEYTLSLDNLDNLEALEHLDYIHLIDRETGADIDLLRDSTYTFHATGSDANRFTVKLSPSATHYPLSTTHFAHLSGDRLVIDGEGALEAYDMMGRRLFRQELNTEHFTLSTSAFPAAGVYILRLAGHSQKVVITK